LKKLERRLSLSSVVAISIGGMLGSGIFVLPGLAAAKAGPSVWLAYLLAGICVLPAALSKAELATAMPTSGGTYIYIERTFGPLMGTISGIGLWLSLLLKSSFALVGFGAYLLVLADVPLRMAALFFLGLIVLINLMGVKKVGQVQTVVVSLSLIGLGVLTVLGLIDLDVNRLRPFFTHGTTGLLAATAFVFVSYAGVTKVAAIAEEIIDPDRNLPIAMLLALGLVTLIYALVSFTLVGNIDSAALTGDIRPIYSLAERVAGPALGIGAAVLGVVTLASMANSGVLAASRFPFAMSRDKLVPEFFRRVHPRLLTPAAAIIATGIVMAFVILLLDVEKIAKLASGFKIMMFILVNISVIVLRETGVGWYTPRYRSPLYPWIQLFGVITGLVLLYFLGGAAVLGAAVITLLGGGVYYAYGRSRVQRRGVLRLYAHRPAAFLLYRRNPERNPHFRVLPQRPDNLDGRLAEEAGAVVPLFGKERSAEMLVEVATGLAAKGKVQVVHLQEVPDQTILDALLEDDPQVLSLNRRISAMAASRQVDIDFDAAVTHDLVHTVQEISEQTHCRWLVAGWGGRAGNGLWVRNPIGWLLTHVHCNFALFKDNGVRYIRRILVAVRPGRSDEEFVIACDRIARSYGAQLTLLRVVTDPAHDDAALRADSEELIAYCSVPAEIRIEVAADPTGHIVESAAAYDLLIIGTPNRVNWRNILLGSGKDRIADRAPCSVLRLTLGTYPVVATDERGSAIAH
jgi:amino acid transporter/nucleotide-binding universal stress UspA family protein